MRKLKEQSDIDLEQFLIGYVVAIYGLTEMDFATEENDSKVGMLLEQMDKVGQELEKLMDKEYSGWDENIKEIHDEVNKRLKGV